MPVWHLGCQFGRICQDLPLWHSECQFGRICQDLPVWRLGCRFCRIRQDLPIWRSDRRFSHFPEGTRQGTDFCRIRAQTGLRTGSALPSPGSARATPSDREFPESTKKVTFFATFPDFPDVPESGPARARGTPRRRFSTPPLDPPLGPCFPIIGQKNAFLQLCRAFSLYLTPFWRSEKVTFSRGGADPPYRPLYNCG
jgi:hypothetical protein